MTVEENVPVVALIVSLIAICLTIISVLQQLFATADGYRRCKHAVIHQYSKRSRWHWIFSEMRFEVRFETPEISIVDVDDRLFKDPERDQKGVPHALTEQESSIGFPKPFPAELAKTLKPDHQLDPTDQTLVTWISLLRQASAQERQIEKVGITPRVPVENGPEVGIRTSVAIYFRVRTWDFMPPDVVRPLASSRLGFVLVLAQRLGMRWKQIDLVQGSLRAEGAGHSLASTNVCGLGIVLQYNFDHHPGTEMLVPSKQVDKMLCGMVPGCKELGIRDFEVVGDNPERREPNKFVDILREIGVSKDAQERMKDNRPGYWRRSLVDDLFGLLCPFLPLQDSPITRILHPIASGPTSHPITPFLYWEGRAVFLTKLRDASSDWDPELKMSILEPFEILVKNYPDDFYCRWATAKNRARITVPNISTIGVRKKGKRGVTTSSSQDLEKLGDSNNLSLSSQEEAYGDLKAMLRQLRTIFDSTTIFFRDLQQSLDEEYTPGSKCDSHEHAPTECPEQKSSLRYLDLVAAHISMADKATQEASQTSKAENEAIDRKPEYAFRQGYFRDKNMIKIAHLYVERMDLVAKYLRERRDRSYTVDMLSDEEIWTAWWVLVIRGICFYMSVNCDNSVLDGLVPASLYNSQTPIWIM